MTNAEILNIAMLQSAIDAGCDADDFLQQDNVIVQSVCSPDVMKHLELPFCALFNIPSARNAIRSSFPPAWAEITVNPKEVC